MKLKVDDLRVHYGHKEVLKKVSIEVVKGEIATLIGPNGSGKSTLVKAVSRLIKSSQGKISFGDRSISEIPTKELARIMAVLPQEKSITADLTVEQLVSYGRNPHLGFGKRFGKKDQEIVEDSLEKTGMLRYRAKSLHKISGGERQRAWISMALAQQPEFLILDEPTTYLDISYQMEVLELIGDLNRSLGITVLMVLHDLNQACRYSDVIYVLKEGKIHCHGAPERVVSPGILADVFNVDAKIYRDSVNDCNFFIPHRLKNA